MSLKRAFGSLNIFRKRKYDEPDKETEEIMEEREADIAHDSAVSRQTP